MLSVIIPAHKEKYLQETIDDILNKAKGDIEVIVVLDGYWANPSIRDDDRVKIIHFSEKRGMRSSINAGVAISKGKYIMKCDAHCKFCEGFDIDILSNIPEDCIMIPTRYELNTDTWEVLGKPIDFQDLYISNSKGIFISRPREIKTEEPIIETMGFQGSCWTMSRKWWDSCIEELNANKFGEFGMESVELRMKTFIAGGKVFTNRNTWYAHQHRKFGRTHKVSNEVKYKGAKAVVKEYKEDFIKLKEHFDGIYKV